MNCANFMAIEHPAIQDPRWLPMNRRTALRILAFCIAWLGCAGLARAAGDFVILGEGNAFWTNRRNSPVSKELAQLRADHTFRSAAYAPGGEFVVLMEGGNYSTNAANLPACKKLTELGKDKNVSFNSIAFSAGGWTILWNQNGSWTIGGVPDDAFKKIVSVSKEGGSLKSITYGPGGAWVLLFNDSGVAYGNVPPALAKVLDNAIKKQIAVRCVAFTSLGTWICLTDNGWRTNDQNHPACKMIAALERQHKDIRWVAVAPEFGPHDFKKWAEYIHQQCNGKLPAGYAFEVLHQGTVVAAGAEGWARTPWQPKEPSVKWTLDKPMGIASVSKTVTAVGLLRLWEESNQQFSLDDPFWEHIKAVCPRAHADVKKVTIRELLEQRTGFKPMDSYESPKDIEQLLTQPLAYPPGTHYNYDNKNFYIARLVLEQIGHVQYTPYIKEHVLRPMGITRMETHFQAKDPTCGYEKLGSKRPGFPFDWNCDATAGAAGWYASVADLGKFLAGLRDDRVLSPSTTEIMYRDLLGWDTSHPGWEKNGGWSWDEGSRPGSRAGSLCSSIFRFPDDVDAVMLINSDAPKSPEELLGQAWQISMQK